MLQLHECFWCNVVDLVVTQVPKNKDRRENERLNTTKLWVQCCFNEGTIVKWTEGSNYTDSTECVDSLCTPSATRHSLLTVQQLCTLTLQISYYMCRLTGITCGIYYAQQSQCEVNTYQLLTNYLQKSCRLTQIFYSTTALLSQFRRTSAKLCDFWNCGILLVFLNTFVLFYVSVLLIFINTETK